MSFGTTSTYRGFLRICHVSPHIFHVIFSYFLHILHVFLHIDVFHVFAIRSSNLLDFRAQDVTRRNFRGHPRGSPRMDPTELQCSLGRAWNFSKYHGPMGAYFFIFPTSSYIPHISSYFLHITFIFPSHFFIFPTHLKFRALILYLQALRLEKIPTSSRIYGALDYGLVICWVATLTNELQCPLRRARNFSKFHAALYIEES